MKLVSRDLGSVPVTSASLRRMQVDAVYDQRKLRHIDLKLGRLRLGGWLLKDTRFESLVPNPKALSVPAQQLQAIAATVDKGEPMAGSGILLQHRLGQQAQAAKALPHIDRFEKQKHASLMLEVQHDRSCTT